MRHFHHCIRSSNYLSYSRFHCSETYSYSRFHCSETRVIFITGYTAVTTLVIPASTEVKHASFSSLYTRSRTYLIYSRFHCSETYSYSRFHCSETRVIFITRYAAVTTLVIPASTEVKHASFSSLYTLQHAAYTYSYSRFHCIETRVISINGYIEGTPPNIPASI